MRNVVLLLTLAASTGCSLSTGPDCVNETRSVSAAGGLLRVSGGTPADTGVAFVSLHEARNHVTKRTAAEHYLWSVRSWAVQRREVAAVHVHERATGRILFDLPIDTLSTPSYVLTNTYTMREHGPLNLPWSEVYDIIGSGRAELDVHLRGVSAPVLRADLAAEYPNWQDFTHAYCS